MMNSTVWYISKYFLVPKGASAGGRGFNLLRELVSQGHEVIAITSDSSHLDKSEPFPGSFNKKTIDGVSVYWLKTLKYKRAHSMRRVLSWVHFDLMVLRLSPRLVPAPDTIVASSLSLTSVIVAYLLSRRYKARLVIEIRDIWPLTLTAVGNFSKRNPFVLALGAIERFAYVKADVIVGTMPNLEEHVREVSASVAPVECVPMGFSTEMENSSPPSARFSRESLGIQKGTFLVCYAGTVGASDALEVLFEAADILRAEADIHIVILGDGDMRNYFEGAYKYLNNITFLGKVPRNEVPGVLAECDVLFFSAYDSPVYKFGISPNKFIDYMLAGKPVIASYSGYRSMLNEAGSGIFIPAEDVDALVNQVKLFRATPRNRLKQMGEQGRKWILANRRYELLARQYERILFP